MDIEAVQSKAGSNVRFLPVILLERRWGGGLWEMEAGGKEERLVAVPQKAHVTGFFIQQARQRQPLHSSPDSLAHGPQEETFGKITAPSLKHGKRKCVFCVSKDMCVLICSCLCLSNAAPCLFYNWRF